MSAVAMVVPVVPPEGMVPLSDKLNPVCERPESERGPDRAWCFTRSVCDVSAFKARLRQMRPEDWEDYNTRENVFIRRPAHDAWGIKKMIFTFCDDFLQKVHI